MKKKIILALMITAGLMTGCAKEEAESPVVQTLEPEAIVVEETEDTTEGEEDTEIVVAAEATITERSVVDGKMQSYLTGEWKDEAVVKRRPLAIMIPNNKPALPQYGISQASVIYEAPVEGRVTRLMGVFEDYDNLDHIGPVRSSRDYYIYEALGFDAIYVNWGLAVPYVADLINSSEVDNISQANDGINKPSTEAFNRITRNGYAKEFTGYMFLDGYNKAVERQGYQTQYHDWYKQGFLFANDGHRAEYEDSDSATKIYPGGTSSNSSGYGDAKPCFTYNPDDGLYYRSEYGGPQIDEMNGDQIAVSNVIFKICHGEVRDSHDYLAFRVHGSGDAYIFTNGKVVKATWKYGDTYKTCQYFDENGNEIVLNQGKTWMCNIWEEYAEYMSWE
jgi:hypothetical protein